MGWPAKHASFLAESVSIGASTWKSTRLMFRSDSGRPAPGYKPQEMRPPEPANYPGLGFFAVTASPNFKRRTHPLWSRGYGTTFLRFSGDGLYKAKAWRAEGSDTRVRYVGAS